MVVTNARVCSEDTLLQLSSKRIKQDVQEAHGACQSPQEEAPVQLVGIWEQEAS